MMKYLILFTAMVLFLSGCTDPDQRPEATMLITLRTEHVEVGVLPQVGGRVVSLHKPGMDNILKAVPELWEQKPAETPKATRLHEMTPYYGHIVWVGPQSGWWLQQDVNDTLLQRKANWPGSVSNPCRVCGTKTA
ncbi:MAG: DUF4380 domain-containing protein [candidate division KSB1 bacterium]|nr:DUF4380 domain-containing protein [candidate division KSB1 bacterium]